MLQDIINKINNKDYQELVNAENKRYREVYTAISLHTLGAQPMFVANNKQIKPYNYFGSDYQDRFNNFLLSRHLRESEFTRNWRLSQYKPMTKEVFSQLDSALIGALFQDSNFSILIPNEADAKYILNDGSFDGLDLISWFKQKGFPQMRDDANGYFVRIPLNGVTSNGDKSVKIIFVNSWDVVYKSYEAFVFRYGKRYFYIDKQVIWELTYDEKSQTYFIAPQNKKGYYAHMLGRLPIDVAGGLWNSKGYYESFYSKALPVADEFISCYSAEQLVDKEASHPFIQIAQDECNVCENGKVQTGSYEDGTLSVHNCSKCHGTGRININPGDLVNVPADQMDKAMVRIVSPDIGVNNYHREKNKQLKEDIYKALNLQNVDAAQSGTAKAIDREYNDMFISNLGNHIFDVILHNTIRDMIAYRNVATQNGKISPAEYTFIINKPTQFRVRTANDLLGEYKQAIESSLPLSARLPMYLDYIDKKFSGDAVAVKKVRIMGYYDVLLCATDLEKQTMLANNAITRNDLIYSTRLSNVLDKILLDKGEEYFMSLDVRKFKDLINEYMSDHITPIADYIE